MSALDPDTHRAVHAEMAEAEKAHTELLGAVDQGADPETLRYWLLTAATHYERAAQRIPEVKRG
jgi:hypothetical protein